MTNQQLTEAIKIKKRIDEIESDLKVLDRFISGDASKYMLDIGYMGITDVWHGCKIPEDLKKSICVTIYNYHMDRLANLKHDLKKI